MRSLRRRLLSVAVCVAVVAAWGVATPRHAAATVAGGCIISGSGVITPGLSSTQVVADAYSFTGTMSPCEGVGLVSEGFSGSMTCPADTVASCVPTGTFTLGGCTGTMTHQGYEYSFTCGQLFAGEFQIVPQPIAVSPVANYVFMGTFGLATP
jgi:hypothetical protein